MAGARLVMQCALSVGIDTSRNALVASFRNDFRPAHPRPASPNAFDVLMELSLTVRSSIVAISRYIVSFCESNVSPRSEAVPALRRRRQFARNGETGKKGFFENTIVQRCVESYSYATTYARLPAVFCGQGWSDGRSSRVRLLSKLITLSYCRDQSAGQVINMQLPAHWPAAVCADRDCLG